MIKMPIPMKKTTSKSFIIAALTACHILISYSYAEEEVWNLKPQNLWATQFTLQSPGGETPGRLKFNSFELTRKNRLVSLNSTGEPVGELSWYSTSAGNIEYKDLETEKTYKVSQFITDTKSGYTIFDDAGLEQGVIEGSGNEYFSTDSGMNLLWKNGIWHLTLPNPSPYRNLFVSFAAFQSRRVVSNAILAGEITLGAVTAAVGITLYAKHTDEIARRKFNTIFLDDLPVSLKSVKVEDDWSGTIQTTTTWKLKLADMGNLTAEEKTELFRTKLKDFPEHSVRMEFGVADLFKKPQKFRKARKWYYDRLNEIDATHAIDMSAELKDLLEGQAQDPDQDATERLLTLLKTGTLLALHTDQQTILFKSKKGVLYPFPREKLRIAYDSAMLEFEKVEAGNTFVVNLLKIARAKTGSEALQQYAEFDQASLSEEDLDKVKSVLEARIESCQSFKDLAPEVNDGNITKIYNKLSLQFHPDKFQGKKRMDGSQLQHSGLMQRINSLFEDWQGKSSPKGENQKVLLP